MQRKVELWLVYLMMILGVVFTIGFGFLVGQELRGKTRFQPFSTYALLIAELPLKFKQAYAQVFRLELALPSDPGHEFSGFQGKPNTSEIYLLQSRYDGDRKESVVELVDLRNFEIIHHWNPDLDLINKAIVETPKIDQQFLDEQTVNYADYRAMIWHPMLLENGNLLYGNRSLQKISKCGDLIWQNIDDVVHHSIEKDADGNFWVPVQMSPLTGKAEIFGRNYQHFTEDALRQISPTGETIFTKSLLEIFQENDMELMLTGRGHFNRDPFHLNDIQPALETTEYWHQGDLFLSIRDQSMIMHYRPSTNEIINIIEGLFVHQHDIDLLPGGKISIFDNNAKVSYKNRLLPEIIKVRIYNFETKTFSSYLEKALVDNDVITTIHGRSQILPNGDLLVEQTQSGRLLYYDGLGSLQWQHVNRASDGRVYPIRWSRLLYENDDLENVDSLLDAERCN